MSLYEAFLTAVFCMLTVFAVLIVLSLTVYSASKIIRFLENRKSGSQLKSHKQ